MPSDEDYLAMSIATNGLEMTRSQREWLAAQQIPDICLKCGTTIKLSHEVYHIHICDACKEHESDI